MSEQGEAAGESPGLPDKYLRMFRDQLRIYELTEKQFSAVASVVEHIYQIEQTGMKYKHAEGMTEAIRAMRISLEGNSIVSKNIKI